MGISLQNKLKLVELSGIESIFTLGRRKHLGGGGGRRESPLIKDMQWDNYFIVWGREWSVFFFFRIYTLGDKIENPYTNRSISSTWLGKCWNIFVFFKVPIFGRKSWWNWRKNLPKKIANTFLHLFWDIWECFRCSSFPLSYLWV